MKYIIDGIKTKSGDKLYAKSFLIQDQQIIYIADQLSKLSLPKMDGSQFLITPGMVYFEEALGLTDSFHDFKSKIKQLISKGCTTVLVSCHVQYESELSSSLKQIRKRMMNSPLDYIIGVTIPLSKLKPSVIHFCKRNQLPFLKVQIDMEDISHIPWGWIREALFFYSLPIIPVWDGTNYSAKQLKSLRKQWEQATVDFNLATAEIGKEEPVSIDLLKKIGLYPTKGELLIGSDLDYNMYHLGKESKEVEDSQHVDYDKGDPTITVHKGRIIKVCEDISFQPGNGIELKIKVPGHFSSHLVP